MDYGLVREGRFLARPNRFVAEVRIEDEVHTVHVKNTGRCGELLLPETKVYLVDGNNPKRKTRYDLIVVEKGDLLVNLDSQAPNKVFREWAESGAFRGELSFLRGEKVYGNSRFDIYYEYEKEGVLRKGFVEIKGVTLEEEGVARFPDAPTQRGVKHIYEMIEAQKEGYEGNICFVVQMEGMRYVTPNRVTHPAFGQALEDAKAAGVEIFALGCVVTPHSLKIVDEVPVVL